MGLNPTILRQAQAFAFVFMQSLLPSLAAATARAV